MINHTVRLKESVCVGQSVIQFAPSSTGSEDYNKLADEIIRRRDVSLEQAKTAMIQYEGLASTQSSATPEPVLFPRDKRMQARHDNGSHEKQKVVLDFSQQLGNEIKIAGEFNDWIPDGGIETIYEQDGIKKVFYVSPGDYEYRLVVDGRWKNDPTNPNKILNPLGVHNSMLHVATDSELRQYS
jgi:hypothetical protein